MSLEADDTAAPVALPPGDSEEIAYAMTFWDETEIIVKEAEQINRAMIVPAVSELRYGGRKLIDYLSSLGRSDRKAQRTHLEDFVQCCVRARHDAIDAIISYITLYLEELEAAVSADLIEKTFSGYGQLKQHLFKSATLIAESRRNRETRNDIYSIIKSEYIEQIIAEYKGLSGVRDRLFAGQRARDREQNRASWAIAGSVAFLAASILIASLLFLS